MVSASNWNEYYSSLFFPFWEKKQSTLSLFIAKLFGRYTEEYDLKRPHLNQCRAKFCKWSMKENSGVPSIPRKKKEETTIVDDSITSMN